MQETIKEYFDEIRRQFLSVSVTDKIQKRIDFYAGIENVMRMILKQSSAGKKIMFIGNGASAAISSHMSADFSKNGNIRAMSFNDGPLLTCIGNDYGYMHVFEKPIELFADPGDILIAISSSGKSENILRGVNAGCSKGCFVVTLSGFDIDNPLSSMGDYNFYVPSNSYGPVEIIHHAICHCMLDTIIQLKKQNLGIEEL